MNKKIAYLLTLLAEVMSTAACVTMQKEKKKILDNTSKGSCLTET